uniref:Tyrosine-protein kinase n=1 Tax=Glossina morsitans morsitans TaxID=37546 RepID=A0A1B0FHV1_GLOMM
MNRDEDLCWYHGKLSRENAEELIKNGGNLDGTFLIRESSTAAGDFVLTLLFQGEVCHYQIRRHGEDAFFSIEDKIKILHGLETLVDFYQQAANGLVTKLTKFIRKDPPPNDTRSQGTSNLLHRAVMKNNYVVVSELLKCGYRNVDAKNRDGQTAMHLIALHGDEKMLQLLIKAGVNVNCMDTANYMPLHVLYFINFLFNVYYACRYQSGSFIKSLLLAQANVQGRNIKNGYVPLHEAAKCGNLEAVKELLSFHAPLLPRTSLGEFPLDLAKRAGHREVVAFLESYILPPARTLKSQWYHGTLTRDEAIETLMEFSKTLRSPNSEDVNTNMNSSPAETDTTGCFLIRFSDRKRVGSGYVLTMFSDNTIKNFIISQSSKFLFIDDGPYLPSLEHLVEHFMHFADGLPVNLRYPIAPKPKPPLPLFSTMPRTNHKKPLDILIGLEQGSYQLDVNKSTSPRKNVENKGTLRKENKTRLNINSTNDKLKISSEEGIQKAEDFIKNLSFSTDFNESNISTPLMNEFYNVPKNNSVVDMVKKASNFKEDLSPNDEVIKICIEEKTEDEVDYFTKSDVVIEHERKQTIYHQSCTEEYVAISEEGFINTFQEGNALESKAVVPDIDSGSAKDVENLSYLVSSTSNMNEATNCKTACNYFIPRDHLMLETIIGEGEFGSVYKGLLIHPEANTGLSQKHREIAIKTLRDEHCPSNSMEFLREASVMIHLKHHCIVQLIGISKEETLMMVQELVPLGSMLHFILEQKDTIRVHYELKLWASQIACGMEYLESNHFVHRDLAARNILLASRNQAKISDFGLSRALGSDGECYQASQGGKWPIKYAPESYNNGLFSHASDVWSFGITLWEMFSFGEAPFGNIRGVDAIQLIESGYRLPQPPLCPIHIYKIIQSCWNYKAKDRPTFHYLTDFFSRDPDYQNIVELIKTTHIN